MNCVYSANETDSSVFRFIASLGFGEGGAGVQDGEVGEGVREVRGNGEGGWVGEGSWYEWEGWGGRMGS